MIKCVEAVNQSALKSSCSFICTGVWCLYILLTYILSFVRGSVTFMQWTNNLKQAMIEMITTQLIISIQLLSI